MKSDSSLTCCTRCLWVFVTGVGAVMDVDGNVCCIVLVMTFCVVIFVDDEPAEVKTEMN